jgi:hypothetical protein
MGLTPLPDHAAGVVVEARPVEVFPGAGMFLAEAGDRVDPLLPGGLDRT